MPSWKKILQSGSAIHVLNITASNLPQVSQTHVVGYNPTTGQFTYFASSSVTPACVTPSPVIDVYGANFYNPSPSGSHFTPQFNSGWYGCSGSIYLEATNLNTYNFTPTYQWYNSSSPPSNPILDATGSTYYPSASGQYSVKINDNTCEAYSTHVNVEFLPSDAFSTGSVSANQTVTVGVQMQDIVWNITTNPATTPSIIDTGLPPGVTLSIPVPLFTSGSAQVRITGRPTQTGSYTYNLNLSPRGCQQNNQYPFSYGQGVITVNTASTATLFISGTLTYNNTAETPITNTTLYLKDNNLSTIASTTTNLSGSYIFDVSNIYFGQPLPTGTYYIIPDIRKFWAGVNSVDALAVQRSFTGAAPLVGLPLKAADVNGSNSVNSLDALAITRRFTSIIPSFTVGDWAFEQVPLNWGGVSVTRNIKALSYGDVNGSRNPSTL